jgi:hypothetical protein
MCPDLQRHTTTAFDNTGKYSSTEKGRIFPRAAKHKKRSLNVVGGQNSLEFLCGLFKDYSQRDGLLKFVCYY